MENDMIKIFLYIIILLCIIGVLYSVCCIFDFKNEPVNASKYRIVEKRNTGCEDIFYTPEKTGIFSENWFPVESEYCEFFNKMLPKSFNSLKEAKEAIHKDIQNSIEENKRNTKFKGYEKIYKY